MHYFGEKDYKAESYAILGNVRSRCTQQGGFRWDYKQTKREILIFAGCFKLKIK